MNIKNLKHLTVEQARELFETTYSLDFESLKDFSEEISALLTTAEKPSSLWIPKVRHITEATAAHLGTSDLAILDLSGLEELSTASLRHLVHGKTTTLWLGGLRTLDTEQAELLASWEGGDLHIDTEELSMDVAEILARSRADMLFLEYCESRAVYEFLEEHYKGSLVMPVSRLR